MSKVAHRRPQDRQADPRRLQGPRRQEGPRSREVRESRSMADTKYHAASQDYEDGASTAMPLGGVRLQERDADPRSSRRSSLNMGVGEATAGHQEGRSGCCRDRSRSPARRPVITKAQELDRAASSSVKACRSAARSPCAATACHEFLDRLDHHRAAPRPRLPWPERRSRSTVAATTPWA